MASVNRHIHFGLDKPDWLPRKFFLLARVATGSVIGVILFGYLMALRVSVAAISAGEGIGLGELAALLVGFWVIKETAQRMTSCEEWDEDEDDTAFARYVPPAPKPAPGSVNA